MKQRPIEPKNQGAIASVNHALHVFHASCDTTSGDLAPQNACLCSGHRRHHVGVLGFSGMAHAHGKVTWANEREVHAGNCFAEV